MRIALLGAVILAVTASFEVQAAGARTPEALVQMLIVALNAKHARVLAEIYAPTYVPESLCNSFDYLVYGTVNSGGPALVVALQDLSTSSASLLVTPRDLPPIKGQRRVIFGLHWAYTAISDQGEVSEDLLLTVKWRLEEQRGVLQVAVQETSPCLP